MEGGFKVNSVGYFITNRWMKVYIQIAEPTSLPICTSEKFVLQAFALYRVVYIQKVVLNFTHSKDYCILTMISMIHLEYPFDKISAKPPFSWLQELSYSKT